MQQPLQVRFELAGWSLLFALLERRPGCDEELSALRRATAETIRRRVRLESLAAHPTLATLRKLFRAAGCDPTRYRPSSEALLRRVLKGQELPPIDPLVDINNCLSLQLAVPCCVMAEPSVEPPYVLRAGRSGESYESLKGPFNLAGKPLLADARGPCDAPITGSRRVMIRPDTRRAWLVAYLPQGAVESALARQSLERLLHEAPVAELLRAAAF